MQNYPVRFHVLAVGNFRRAEFDEVAQWLHRHATLTVACDTEQAADYLRSVDIPPTLIVFAQCYPGQYASDQIERLRRLAPLTRLMALLGSWCEGEARSGKPYAGVSRAYWHQWLPRIDVDLETFLQGKCPMWGLPPTLTESERWLRMSRVPLESREGLIAIHAPDSETTGALMDVCSKAGYATLCIKPGQKQLLRGATACLWDVPGSAASSVDRARRLLEQLGRVPLVAIINFPRIDDCQQLRRAGAAAIISKPYVTDDLLWQLDQLRQAGGNQP